MEYTKQVLRFIIDKFDLFFTAVVILSVLAGALFATNQTDIKRLIAYSGTIDRVSLMFKSFKFSFLSLEMGPVKIL